MYLAKGTAGDSIANILPENIWVRLGLYVVILAVLFFLVSLPHIIPEIKAYRAKKKTAAVATENVAVETVPETVSEPIAAETEMAVEKVETPTEATEMDDEIFATPPEDIR